MVRQEVDGGVAVLTLANPPVNALGAALGGGVISLGLGYAVVPVAGGLLAASGVLLVWLGRASKRAAQPVKA